MKYILFITTLYLVIISYGKKSEGLNLGSNSKITILTGA
jgi:hypothetical protein